MTSLLGSMLNFGGVYITHLLRRDREGLQAPATKHFCPPFLPLNLENQGCLTVHESTHRITTNSRVTVNILTIVNSLSQWLNFKLFGITYLVGKIKFKLFFSGSIGWVSERMNLAMSEIESQISLSYIVVFLKLKYIYIIFGTSPLPTCGFLAWICFLRWFFTFYHGTSSLNHHLGEDLPSFSKHRGRANPSYLLGCPRNLVNA